MRQCTNSMQRARAALVIVIALMHARTAAHVHAEGPATVPGAGLAFIDTSFENASPLWYEVSPDGTILVHLTYDHERSSPNRAAGHIHFRIEAAKGTTLTLEFKNLENIYNGR